MYVHLINLTQTGMHSFNIYTVDHQLPCDNTLMLEFRTLVQVQKLNALFVTEAAQFRNPWSCFWGSWDYSIQRYVKRGLTVAATFISEDKNMR